MKKIEFIPESLFSQDNLSCPTPAFKSIPKWYSKMNLFISDNNSTYRLTDNGSPTTTLKACTPFLDALSFGYTWCLPLDLEVRKNYNNFKFFFQWRPEEVFISHHHVDQHPGLPSAVNGDNLIFKFKFHFAIKTPKGYSVFITHPLNRHDLTFRTFSGVVDTDKYNLPIEFPFQLLDNKEDSFIIEKGTPVCQIIPFKRDNWNSFLLKYNQVEMNKKYFNFRSIIKRSYKNQYWSRKKYI